MERPVRRRRPLPTVSLTAIFALMAAAPGVARAADELKIGDPAPAFGTRSLRGDAEGITFPADLRGRAALLVAVDVADHSSRVLLEKVRDLARTRTYRWLGVVAVQRGPLKGRALRRAERAIEELELPFPVVIDQKAAIASDYNLADATWWGAGDWPTVFVVDPRGRVRGRFAGIAFLPDGRVGLQTKLLDALHETMRTAEGPWDEAFLLDIARGSTNPYLKNARREVIASFAPLRVRGIVGVLRRGDWPEDRAVAAGLLGALGRVEAHGELIEAIKWDEDEGVVSAAAQALSEMPTPEVLAALLGVLGYPGDRFRRHRALDALQRATGRDDLGMRDLAEWDRVVRRWSGAEERDR